MMRDKYTIRLARRDELSLLNEVEQAAAVLFREVGFDFAAEIGPLSLDLLRSLQSKDQIWIAAGRDGLPVGFAVVQIIDGLAHLEEISVHPAHGRQGLGRRLIQVVCDWARDEGYPAVTLSTFRDVPWNAPFYERLGFRVLGEEELGPGLLAVREHEARDGLAVRERVCMRIELRVSTASTFNP